MPAGRQTREYPDDIFDNTRMSFGDHIDELRTRMIRALIGLMICLVIGFVLDAIGEAVGNKNIGVGKPMIDIITSPVEQQVRDYYFRRAQEAADKQLAETTNSTPEEIARIREKLADNGNRLGELTAEERAKLRLAPEEMPVVLPTAPLAEALGIPPDQIKKPEVEITARVIPARLTDLNNKGEALLESKQYLTALSAQEPFVVYFKVSILCGIVLSSPWLLYQFWQFVGVGLYPHERKYVAMMFWPSLILFLGGIVLCQVFVIPGSLRALLRFNEFLNIEPDIRLSEWLSLALILPLVFGVSFQTPLVMIFLNRIGMFTAGDYLAKWRYACFILACLAALITPTPDLVTMSYLFGPMFGLYMAGIVFCYYFPGVKELDEYGDDPGEDEIAV